MLMTKGIFKIVWSLGDVCVCNSDPLIMDSTGLGFPNDFVVTRCDKQIF